MRMRAQQNGVQSRKRSTQAHPHYQGKRYQSGFTWILCYPIAGFQHTYRRSGGSPREPRSDVVELRSAFIVSFSFAHNFASLPARATGSTSKRPACLLSTAYSFICCSSCRFIYIRLIGNAFCFGSHLLGAIGKRVCPTFSCFSRDTCAFLY